MHNKEFTILYHREVGKVIDEVMAYRTDDDMWIVIPGTTNSGGNLVQHLIGNLRTYIGLTLGNVPYVRNRDAEFTQRLFSREMILDELKALDLILENALIHLSEEDLMKEYPHEVLAMFPKQSVRLILSHLSTHLSYHLGQINYHRRFVNVPI
ncbi:DUF1572 family protein [Dyadobacter sp. 32]|uniref:DUF1572 family protein n=1 Tax=Dyadobacter sp. 32 TaxID=538966 RepID=UPI0011F02137